MPKDEPLTVDQVRGMPYRIVAQDAGRLSAGSEYYCDNWRNLEPGSPVVILSPAFRYDRFSGHYIRVDEVLINATIIEVFGQKQ